MFSGSIDTHQVKMSKTRHYPNPYEDYSEGKQSSNININGNDVSLIKSSYISFNFIIKKYKQLL